MPDIRRFIKNWDYFYFGVPPKHTTWVVLNTNNIKFSSVWETYQLTATIQPQWAIEDILTWSSSDTSIATVSNTWLVTCVSLWDATITVTTNNWFSASCTVEELKNVYIEFLLVWWGWWGSQYAWWGWWGWWVIQCNNYELEIWNYPVVIWAWGSWIWTCCDWNNWWNSTFNWLIAYWWWWGWWYPSRAGHNWWSWWWAWYYNWTIWYWCAWQWHNWWSDNQWGSWWWGWAWWVWANWQSCCLWWKWWAWIQSSITWTAMYYSPWGSWHSWYNCNQSWNSTWWAASGCQTASNAACYWWWGWWTTTNASYWQWKSGIFVLRYPTSCGYDMTWGTKYTCWAYTIHCFTSSGTLSIN